LPQDAVVRHWPRHNGVSPKLAEQKACNP
jgi:hypothetical protein